MENRAYKTVIYPLTSLSHLQLSGVEARSGSFLGRDAVQLHLAPGVEGVDKNTLAYFPEIDFGNGSIEVDLASTLRPDAPSLARGFIGLAFRIRPEAAAFESVYVRPLNGQVNDQVRRNHTTQYFAYPHYPFSRLRNESPEKYESFAPIALGDWIKMRLEINRAKLWLFLNDSPFPWLMVDDMKLGDSGRGSVGLWADIGTEAHFSNLKITYYDD